MTMIEYLIVAVLSASLSIAGGGYLGYKYGRRVEVRGREVYEAIEAEIKSKVIK